MKTLNEMRSNEEVDREVAKAKASIAVEIKLVSEKLAPMMVSNPTAQKCVTEVLEKANAVVNNFKFSDFSFYKINNLRDLLMKSRMVKGFPPLSGMELAAVSAIIAKEV